MANDDDGGTVWQADQSLDRVLRATNLDHLSNKICTELQLTRLEHFDHINDEELGSLVGLSLPAIRRLRSAIEEERKAKKSSTLKNLLGVKRDRRRTADNNKQYAALHNQKEAAGGQNVAGGSATPEATTCLISKDELNLQEKIGEGSFAVVKRAVWTQAGSGTKMQVAVKLLRDSSANVAEELQLEINNMHKLKFTYLVFELCEGGSLLNRLRANNELPVLLATQLLDFAVQIAKGMAYLQSRHFIHRDLATRNVLLTADERHCKIGDFGLMRVMPEHDEHYVMSTQSKVPFAWCAPESLSRKQFSHASDVWSFGVTLWELFTYGEEPWCGLRGAEILHKVKTGERLEPPRLCPKHVSELMSSCWHAQATQRPSFPTIKNMLQTHHLPVCEVREAHLSSNDRELSVEPQERVLLVSESGSECLCQSVRSRKYGYIPSKSLAQPNQPINDQHPTMNSTSGYSNPDTKSTRSHTHISRPIPASFIHAAHGDARGGPSWGQPDCIEELYLRNPMPLEMTPVLNNTGVSNTEPARVKPERPAPPSASVRPSSAVSNMSNTDLLQCELDNALHLNGASSSSQPAAAESVYGSVDPFAPFDNYEVQSNDPYGAIAQLDSHTPNTYYSVPPTPRAPEQYGTLQNSAPTHITTNTNITNNIARPSAPPVRLPPPPAKSTPSPVNTTVPVANVNVGSQQQPSRVNIPPARPSALPEMARQGPMVGAQSNTVRRGMGVANAPVIANVNTPSCSWQPPAPTPVMNNVNFVPAAASNEPDPFEVSNELKKIIERPRYSDLIAGKSHQWWGRLGATASTTGATAVVGSIGHQSPVWLAGPSNPVNWPSARQEHVTNELLQPMSVRPQTRTARSANSSPSVGLGGAQLSSSASAVVLDEFDPLSSRPAASLVQQVQTLAPFASAERCALVLKRAGHNVSRAACMLKVQKLVDMGVAGDSADAETALAANRWDLNAAADSLIRGL